MKEFPSLHPRLRSSAAPGAMSGVCNACGLHPSALAFVFPRRAPFGAPDETKHDRSARVKKQSLPQATQSQAQADISIRGAFSKPRRPLPEVKIGDKAARNAQEEGWHGPAFAVAIDGSAIYANRNNKICKPFMHRIRKQLAPLPDLTALEEDQHLKNHRVFVSAPHRRLRLARCLLLLPGPRLLKRRRLRLRSKNMPSLCGAKRCGGAVLRS